MPTNRNQQNDNTQGSGKSSMHVSIRGSESSSGRSSGQQASGRNDQQGSGSGNRSGQSTQGRNEGGQGRGNR